MFKTGARLEYHWRHCEHAMQSWWCPTRQPSEMLLCAAFGAFLFTIIIAHFCEWSKYVTFSTSFGVPVRESILCAVWRAQRQSWNMFKIRGIIYTSSSPREQPRRGVLRFTANFRSCIPGDIAPPGLAVVLRLIHGIACKMHVIAQHTRVIQYDNFSALPMVHFQKQT